MSNQTDATLQSALQALVEAAERIASLTRALAQAQANVRAAPPQTPETGCAVSAAGAATAATADVEMVGLTPEQHEICERVINVFETGSVQGNYAAISIFGDGPDNRRQITYGRSQTTEYGNLPELVRMYVDAGGLFSSDLREFLPRIGHLATPLVDNTRFKDLLRRAGAQDPVMRHTQDVFFDRRYFQPAMKWASDNGFTLALSALVIYDSFIHSGSIRSELRAQFAEVPPARGGNEKVWIRSYVDVRHQWLLHHPRPAVRASAYRTKDLAREIARGNWDLSMLPIMANGVPVDAGAGIAADDVGSDAYPEESRGYPDPRPPGGSIDLDDGEIWGDDTFAASMHAPFAAAATADSASLAATILNSPRIRLATIHSSGIADQANARQNIADTAAGGRARRSSYGNAPGGTVMLSPKLLSAIVSLSEEYSFSIAEICGGSHNLNSRHYAGVGTDINIINGRHISASHPDVAAFKARCRELGATEVLGPGAPNHDTHVHAAWPRPT
jgi:chitosanase